MYEFSAELMLVAAKSDREQRDYWLPFWMHSLDTAGIIRKLAKEWLPKHVYTYLSDACGSDKHTHATLKFCALVHDIGKIMYCFQSKIAQSMANSPLQEEILDVVNELKEPGILILEAPMGLGKAEAALAAAEVLATKTCAGGLYFGMPTQATSNGIFPRLEAWASSLSADEGALHAIRLAHGAAALKEYYRELFEMV